MGETINNMAYVEEAIKLLDELDAALSELGMDGVDAEFMQMAIRVLHTLAGASRMFGFVRLADMAAEAKPLLAEAHEGGAPLDAELLRRMRNVSESMRAIVQEGPQTAGLGPGLAFRPSS